MKMIKNGIRFLLGWLSAYGFRPLETITAIRGTPRLIADYLRFRRQNRKLAERWSCSLSAPCLQDWHESSGMMKGHYFHQDLYVAQRICRLQPQRHVDIGSRTDGFVAHVASFREIEVFDIRANVSPSPNIIFRQHDFTSTDGTWSSYCDSISCLHALEHFGLGRYGDTIDVNGYQIGFDGISQLLKNGGRFYLSLPIGPSRVEFNGHRVFSVDQVVELYAPAYTLDRFCFVDDLGDMSAATSIIPVDKLAGLRYGCGIFELVKN